MRKFLILTLFFVTLVPLLPWFGSATIHAQGIANENYYICYVNGFVQTSLYPCSDGHEVEIVKCRKCGEQYMSYETHVCPGEGDDKIWCPHCDGQFTPEEFANHNCLNNESDDEPSGGNPTNGGSNGGGGSGSSTGVSIGGGGSSSTGQNGSSSNNLISVLELKLKSGIKLCTINLPQHLHAQTKNNECTVRAFACAAELMGHDYNIALETMTDLAIKHGYDLVADGVCADQITKVYENYCQITVRGFSTNTIEQSINSGKTVQAITLTDHMVTIIGYDAQFYYTSAGEINGKVTIYPKNDFCGHNIYILNNINSPYK